MVSLVISNHHEFSFRTTYLPQRPPRPDDILFKEPDRSFLKRQRGVTLFGVIALWVIYFILILSIVFKMQDMPFFLKVLLISVTPIFCLFATYIELSSMLALPLTIFTDHFYYRYASFFDALKKKPEHILFDDTIAISRHMVNNKLVELIVELKGKYSKKMFHMTIVDYNEQTLIKLDDSWTHWKPPQQKP